MLTRNMQMTLPAAVILFLSLCTAQAQTGQPAVYLDPSFAMPHLHLGLVAKRSADVETARRELEQALTLLVREDASRILLFGGGFTREALSEFCRAELRAYGGHP